MSKTKIEVFSILMFGVMMLLIPATSITNASEYDIYEKMDNSYYYSDDYYLQKTGELEVITNFSGCFLSQGTQTPPRLIHCDTIFNTIPNPSNFNMIVSQYGQKLVEFLGSETGENIDVPIGQFEVSEQVRINPGGLFDLASPAIRIAICNTVPDGPNGDSRFDAGNELFQIESSDLGMGIIGFCTALSDDCSGEMIANAKLKCIVDNIMVFKELES